MSIKLVFRYWNTRGRVQAVRYMLEDIAATNKNVEYKEEPELLENALESWMGRNKADESVSGPFHTLPVLHWNNKHVFAQTLPIGLLLARKFNLYGKLTASIDEEDALHAYIDGVVSCAYTDVIINILMCVWNQIDFVDDSNPANRAAKKVPNDLKALNGLLKKSSTPFFYDQTEPTIADYFVFEAYTMARYYSEKMIPSEDDRDALMKLEQVMSERPGIANYLKKDLLYKRFTGSPKEAEYMAKLKGSSK
ncbi:unnamed protein product [Adineta ricciae]|uniref:Glutathione S-transferase n=1 Tax=Adineta ricciae TaxID=249248 RepID=A0A815DF79_ADIRI|nr:unnamed protein product [Adineta ricciae]